MMGLTLIKMDSYIQPNLRNTLTGRCVLTQSLISQWFTGKVIVILFRAFQFNVQGLHSS